MLQVVCRENNQLWVTVTGWYTSGHWDCMIHFGSQGLDDTLWVTVTGWYILGLSNWIIHFGSQRLDNTPYVTMAGWYTLGHSNWMIHFGSQWLDEQWGFNPNFPLSVKIAHQTIKCYIYCSFISFSVLQWRFAEKIMLIHRLWVTVTGWTVRPLFHSQANAV